ncbi:MAG: phage holin family protein [Clostridia bacterium]|nr:phage holin family protein [Clostridia bacterium]
MPSILFRWLLNGIALVVVAYVFPGWVRFADLGTAVAAAVLLGIVNAVIRPLVLALTLPLNVATLGLFTFVVNALMLVLVAWLLPGMTVSGFLAAVFASIAVSLVSGVVSWLVGR